MYVYILKLKYDKWYIGHTQNAGFNLEGFVTDLEWMIRYPPIEVVSCEPGDVFEENKITVQYMQRYGIGNVRGGVHSACILNAGAIRQIKKQIWHAEGACARCGHHTHATKECRENTTVDGDFLYTNMITNATNCILN